MLKNDDGSVRITSTDDIQVFNGEQERIKIGRIEDNVYGIRISNADGAPVMETDDDGNLWLKNSLSIETYNNKEVAIGKLDTTSTINKEHGSRIIDANNSFVVYEDGYMKANGGEFTGTIIATGGKIGQMTIGDVEGAIDNMNNIAETTKRIELISKNGFNFKIENNIYSPSVLNFEAKIIGFEATVNQIEWLGSADFNNWNNLGTGATFVLSEEFFKGLNKINNTYYIKIKYNNYEDWATIMGISGGKGEDGNDAIYCIITSDQGNTFKNGNIDTKLTCRVYNSQGELDPNGSIYEYVWEKNGTPTGDKGQTLEIDREDVNDKAVFSCSVQLKEENNG